MREEVEAAIWRLKKNKAPCVDNITAEEIQAGGSKGDELIVSEDMEEEKFPQTWRKSVIVTLYKKKKDTFSCVIITALRSRCGYFRPVVSSSSFFFFSSPNLSGRRVDVYYTSTHGVALVRI